jgi:hypothetical protein
MVRRGITTMATVVILAMIGIQAASAGGDGPLANGDSHLTVHNVFGLRTLKLQHFDFFAVGNGDGSASGWFNYRDLEDGTPFAARGSVTCLTVIDRDAWVGATIEHSNDSTVVGLGGWWHVTDNGAGVDSPPDITTFLGVGSLDATAAFCADHPAYAHPFPIDGGDIRVRD